jgi:hypothetical protein
MHAGEAMVSKHGAAVGIHAGETTARGGVYARNKEAESDV